MTNPFENKTFIEKTTGLKYTFTRSDLRIDTSPAFLGKYEVYEEGEKLYLQTHPSIASEDLLVAVTDLQIEINERYRETRVPFAQLIET